MSLFLNLKFIYTALISLFLYYLENFTLYRVFQTIPAKLTYMKIAQTK